MDFLGNPESLIESIPSSLVPISQVIDASIMYENRNMVKHGTHSTNCLVKFYEQNQNVWNSEFVTKEKFFAKSTAFFETLLESSSNIELVKHNIYLKLHARGEIKVYYTDQNFLKRVQLMNNNHIYLKSKPSNQKQRGATTASFFSPSDTASSDHHQQ